MNASATAETNIEKYIAAAVAALPPLATRNEAAVAIRRRPDYVTELVKAGELAAIQRAAKQGSRLLIPRDSIADYLRRSVRVYWHSKNKTGSGNQPLPAQSRQKSARG